MLVGIQKGDPSGAQQGEDLQCLAFQGGILETRSFFIRRYLLFIVLVLRCEFVGSESNNSALTSRSFGSGTE